MYEIFEQLLLKYGVTPYQVSKDTGISQSTLSSWKSRNTKISLDKAQIIADYFNVSIDYLMNVETKTENENCLEVQDSEEKELLILCRKVGDISKKDKDELIKLFKNNIDFYLKTKGL